MYKYKVEFIGDFQILDIEKLLNEVGEYDWELVCVSNGYAYFKQYDVGIMRILENIDATQFKEAMYG